MNYSIQLERVLLEIHMLKHKIDAWGKVDFELKKILIDIVNGDKDQVSKLIDEIDRLIIEIKELSTKFKDELKYNVTVLIAIAGVFIAIEGIDIISSVKSIKCFINGLLGLSFIIVSISILVNIFKTSKRDKQINKLNQARQILTNLTPELEFKATINFSTGELTINRSCRHQGLFGKPYIDIETGREMLAINDLVNACNIDLSNIIFDAESIKISNGRDIIEVSNGSNIMYVSGTPITMDQAMVIGDDERSYVPMRYVVMALGLQVSYDEVTKVATFTNYYQ